MTQALNTFKKTGTVHEQAQVNELKLQFEGFKAAGGATMRTQQVCEEGCTEHYHPNNSRQIHVSASPTVWAYGKYQQIKQAQPQHTHMQRQDAAKHTNTLTKQQQYFQGESEYIKPTCYNEKFTPNQDYIYVPKTDTKYVVDYQKSQVGQTHFIEAMDQSTEQVGKALSSTQYKNDYCSDNKAQHNMGPVTNAFCVKCNDGTCFGHTYSRHISEEGKQQGYVTKHVDREPVLPAVNDRFVEQCKTGKVEQTTTLRPMVGGTTSVRQIKVDEWKENEEVLKRLKYDKKTTNRTFFTPMTDNAHAIAQNDRQRSHAIWYADQRGTNPCGGGVPLPLVTSTNLGFVPSVKEMDRRKCNADNHLCCEAVESAKNLYGDQEGLDDWVHTLTIGEQQQLAFLGQQASTRTVEPYMEYQGKKSLI